MAVIKKLGKPIRKVPSGICGGQMASFEKPVDIALPTAPKEQVTDLVSYAGLLYGREKIGKTTVLSSFPGAIFLTCEPGTKGLSIYEFNSDDGGVKNWDIMRSAVKALVADSTKRFKTVVIDTADCAYDMCLDWVCSNRNIEYPGQDSSGKEDFGKSWKAVKQEFVEQIHLLIQAGYGIWFTSHAKETEIKTKSGQKYDKIYPSMSNQARAVIEALIDFFFYAEYMQGPDGKTMRVLICEGDETLWAGGRPTPFIQQWPRFIPMTNDGTAFDLIESAFNGQYHGLDPMTLMPTKDTKNTSKNLLVKAREESKASKLKKIIKKV